MLFTCSSLQEDKQECGSALLEHLNAFNHTTTNAQSGCKEGPQKNSLISITGSDQNFRETIRFSALMQLNRRRDSRFPQHWHNEPRQQGGIKKKNPEICHHKVTHQLSHQTLLNTSILSCTLGTLQPWKWHTVFSWKCTHRPLKGTWRVNGIEMSQLSQVKLQTIDQCIYCALP